MDNEFNGLCSTNHHQAPPAPTIKPEPIAIIGVGCRFPGGANGPRRFWKLLCDGVDAVTEVPPERWDKRSFYSPEPERPGKTNSRWGGFIDGVDCFDAAFFGISPREASRMDPQQRLLLEVGFEAFQDAGQVMDRLASSMTGVFVGISNYDYSWIQTDFHDKTDIDAHSPTGWALSLAANRISYFFNLKGPSLVVDTACSSSLVAVHLACQSLWNRQCSLALAGGVNVLITPEGFIGFSRMSMLSPDGRCKAFDARANGFVRGEGAGLVVLKPLSSAISDDDPIYAVIRATGINQDGRTPGLTVPSQHSQENLLRQACRDAAIAPADVQYIEAHGTGTPVGDPLEAFALGRVFGPNRPDGNRCIIGSVKTNIGHLEPASGIAGLIKASLALKHRLIPPSLHFQVPNPQIPFEDLGLRIAQNLEPWPQTTGPALAGVNSFGFGGTNAHVLLEGSQFQLRQPPTDTNDAPTAFPYPVLIPLSARSRQALRDLAKAHHDELLSTDLFLHDISFTACRHRTHHDHRMAIVAQSKSDAGEQLAAWLAEQSGESTPAEPKGAGRCSRLAFVFSGQGPQWWAMGRQLLHQEPLFREMIQRCDVLHGRLARWSLLDELMADEPRSRLHETEVSQPAIFALQVGLAALWQSWGIVPEAVVGHSVGELAAAYVAGVLTLEDAVFAVFHRGRCMKAAPSRGRMLAVGLSHSEAESLLTGYEDRIAIAAINSPNSVTLSGDPDCLAGVARELDRRQVFNRFLQVDYAYHSPQLDSVREELIHSLRAIEPNLARISFISTVTGGGVQGPELGPDYWWQNFRRPVRFAEAIDQLCGSGYHTVVELSPHPVLGGAVMDCFRHRGHSATVLASLRRNENERTTLLRSLGVLYTQGHAIAWDKAAPANAHRVELPQYPWQHDSHWHERAPSRLTRLGLHYHPLLGGQSSGPFSSWDNQFDQKSLPYLKDHRVGGHVLLPGTAYLEMAAAVARAHRLFPCAVQQVKFKKACFLPEHHTIRLQTVFDPDTATFTVCGRANGADQPLVTHATALIRGHTEEPQTAALDPAAVTSRCSTEISSQACYAGLLALGLEYGPAFRGIERLWQGDSEAIADVRVSEHLQGQLADYVFHPAVLDACIQTLFGALPGKSWQSGGAGRAVYLPVEIEEVRVHGCPHGRLWCHARLVECNRQEIVANVSVYDAAGQLIWQARGLRCQAVGAADSSMHELDNLVYEHNWQLCDNNQGEIIRLPFPIAVCQFDSVSSRVRQEAKRQNEENKLSERAGRFLREIDSLCTCFIWQALNSVEEKLQVGQRFSPDALAARLGILPRHQRLFDRLLGILHENGFLRRVHGDWELQQRPTDVEVDSLWQSLIARFPAFLAELILIRRCGENLRQILRGEIDPLLLIFPDGSLTLAEQLYQDSPSFCFHNQLAADAVKAMLDQLPPGRTVRILEIGAGTGGLTSYVLPAVADRCSSYVFSDLSNHFFGKAQQKFSDYPFVSYQRLDIETDPAGQSFAGQSFDIVLASHVLHATSDLRQAMGHVKQLLSPEAILLLVEKVNPPRWYDLVFGPLEGWWRFSDTDLRPDYSMLPFPKWQVLLENVGFMPVVDVSLGQAEQYLGNAVILARLEKDKETGSQAHNENDASPASIGRVRSRGSWLLFADRGGLARDLAEMLRNNGESCTLVSQGDSWNRHGDQVSVHPGCRDDMQRVLDMVSGEGQPPCRGVIHLWNLDAPGPEGLTVDVLETAQQAGCLSIVHLVQALHGMGMPPRLWLVTRGVQAVKGEPGPVAMAQSPVWGLGRVVINEQPAFRCTIIDLDPHPGSGETRALFDDLGSNDGEEEVAWRKGRRFVHRFARTGFQKRSQALRPGQSYRLEGSPSHTLDGLTARAVQPRVPAAREVAVEVRAAGLNFSDVLKALGLYPGLSDGPVPLGLECSGTITAIGPEVDGFRVGDEVVAIAPFSFASSVTCPVSCIANKPESLSFQEAATIPIAFLTAYYALDYLGRMSAGESILIHSATGGVGLAALQLARNAGLEVFATAGTEEKREFLRALGVKHVLDSRSLAFADEVLVRTASRGVDLVLNSLAGEALSRSVDTLAEFGRFLEIGKRDIYQDSRLRLRPFRKNLSFLAVDLDRGLRERPALFGRLLRQVLQQFDEGRLTPLPHRVFPMANILGAFRHMAQARHIGKIVVSMPDRHTVPVQPSDEPEFRADATYLITGGAGGFGLATAQWLVDRGARHLVLVGRRGAGTPDVDQAVGPLRRAGVKVKLAAADVADSGQLKALLSEVAHTMPPLRGIVHAAMVLDDCLLSALNGERLNNVLRPKMHGCWNLHCQTRNLPLDFFVVFSSMSSILGVPGQANYAAANAFLDALAHFRRAQGLPALTVNWGYLSDVGYVAQHPEVAQRFVRMGVKSFTPRQALAILGKLLQHQAVQVGVMNVEWSRLLSTLTPNAVSPRFAALNAQGSADVQATEQNGVPTRSVVLAAPPAQRKALLKTLLCDKLAKVLGMASSKLDTDKPLTDLGMDSLMAAELRNWLEGHLRVALPIVELMQGPSVDRLAELLLARVDSAGEPTEPGAELASTQEGS